MTNQIIKLGCLISMLGVFILCGILLIALNS
jgi:hypothetical protein